MALVDGNNHQIDRIEAEAADRDVEVTVVVDLIHVLEYVWGAAGCFFDEADPAAEVWVRHRALAILGGKARQVATGIRRRASSQGLSPTKRAKADACARYLINKANYLDYPTALASGRGGAQTAGCVSCGPAMPLPRAAVRGPERTARRRSGRTTSRS